VSGQDLGVGEALANHLLPPATQPGGVTLAASAALGVGQNNEMPLGQEFGQIHQAQQVRAKAAADEKAAKLHAAAVKKQQALEFARIRAADKLKAMRGAQRNPKPIALIMLKEMGWSASQFQYLDKLWTRESNWNYKATNAGSGAYGIPQALPGRKMISAGSDWMTNPVTQIKWGLNYIKARYGSPSAAWSHSQSYGWY
jgi:hypothetical protein